jgi:hypothetical protein
MASAANCQPQRIPYSLSHATVEAISVWPKLGSCQSGSYWSRVQSKNRASHPGEELACKWPPGRMSTHRHTVERLRIEAGRESGLASSDDSKNVGRGN